MRKILILCILVICLSFAYAKVTNKQIVGGFNKVDVDLSLLQAYQVGLNYLQQKNVINSNSNPQLTGVYSQVVSGVKYRFVLKVGNQNWSVDVFYQSWTNTLQAVSYQKA
ncbi:hypothetical protein TTHERM_01163050 (macronuclear) [Tetrahymena thermophila SB210]|uniref:Cystatin domain-containing protein n=1 Tax=Tetrahymena thermophila (strain SB210) TaxID=312017 RepID=Q23NC8_TETTS|nr:hypothetical protein TTHERM_01163050 [Tetrahymena thermophila SB210]EAR98054.1 hypothetical protein TTHERM_01163050 [Tetrahymena thermophila SB210]|eukprot:XP_001018299.1 hypothetical protein TTHERM_01163050 [Tetrahymena thermophila SB210]